MADQSSDNPGTAQHDRADSGSEDDTVQISQTELAAIRGSADGAKLSAKDLREINRRRRADQENAEQDEDDSTRTFDRSNLQSLLETDRSEKQDGSPPDQSDVDSADAQGPTTAVASGDAVDEALAQGGWGFEADSPDPTDDDAQQQDPTTAVASGDAVDEALAKQQWDFNAPDHEPEARPSEPSLAFEDLDIVDDVDVHAALNAAERVAAEDRSADREDDTAIDDNLDFDVADDVDIEIDDVAGPTFDSLEEMLEEVDETDGGLDELSDADIHSIVFGDSEADIIAGEVSGEDTTSDDIGSPPSGSKPPPMPPPTTPSPPSPAPAADAVQPSSQAPSPQVADGAEEAEIADNTAPSEASSTEVSAISDDVELGGYHSTASLLLLSATALIGLGLVVISILSLIGISLAAMDGLAASLLLALGILILGGALTIVLQQR